MGVRSGDVIPVELPVELARYSFSIRDDVFDAKYATVACGDCVEELSLLFLRQHVYASASTVVFALFFA